MYYFGLYHWRRRLRRLFVGVLAVALGAAGLRRDERPVRVLSAGLFAWGTVRAGGCVRRLLSPTPWHVERRKYEALASVLPLTDADCVVDVGCGTGRSLVGLAPAVAEDATFLALDVFDDRVILGNGPALARRNAARAGRTVVPVRGDAATLPLADGRVDVLTACRVLHDLPKADAERALREARRVLAPDGTLGVLELPIPHEVGADPCRYWRMLLTDAGFEIREERTLDGEYFVFAATPASTSHAQSR